MATSVLQSWLGRLREDWAGAGILPGCTLRLSDLTEGSLLDFRLSLSGDVATAEGILSTRFYVGTTIGTGTALEGSHTTVGAGKKGELQCHAVYGPITAAEAASGLYVQASVGISAGDLTINAKTTPATQHAVFRVDEMDSDEMGRPDTFPRLLYWLRADEGIALGSASRVASWANQAPSGKLAFDGQTGNFTAGLVLTGGTSGATAIIQSQVDSGAAGTLFLTDVSGTFADNEVITDSATGSASVNGTLSALTVTAGASPPLFVPNSLNGLPGISFDSAAAESLLFADTPGQGDAFGVVAIVSLDAGLRAGASLLNPEVADAASCIRVCLSNATVNRNSLRDTANAEYVSTSNTVTSGAAAMGWRFNLADTTGRASVNGLAEVSDTSFGGGITMGKWKMIGSTDGATYAIGGFRLHELVIYSRTQATNEDPLDLSTMRMVTEYLNRKWEVYDP